MFNLQHIQDEGARDVSARVTTSEFIEILQLFGSIHNITERTESKLYMQAAKGSSKHHQHSNSSTFNSPLNCDACPLESVGHYKLFVVQSWQWIWTFEGALFQNMQSFCGTSANTGQLRA